MSQDKIEYLVIINSEDTFCASVDAFKKLIESYDNIKFSNNKICFDNINFDYEIQSGDVGVKYQKFFHVKFYLSETEKKSVFRRFLREIRTILAKASGAQPEVLWDDLSGDLASLAYPKIYETENLMRKLITKFMLTNIGFAWTKSAVPKQVADAIDDKRASKEQNYLYQADFIQLSDFLFKEYVAVDSRKIIDKLDVVSGTEDVELDELKQLVPRSNWDRYFQPIVNCKRDYLKPRWEKLYDLRCKVAHNKFINEEEYEEIDRLVREISFELNQALDNLDRVHVEESQKESVAENIASNFSSLYAQFIELWNEVSDLLIDVSILVLDKNEVGAAVDSQNFPFNLVDALYDKGLIFQDHAYRIEKLANFRNMIIHGSNIKVPKAYMIECVSELEEVKAYLFSVIEFLDNSE